MKGSKAKKELPAAALAALSRTAAGAPWPGILLFGAGAAVLRKLPKAQTVPRWVQAVQALWGAFLLNQTLRWAGESWQKAGDRVWIGLILLALAWWLARKGREAVSAAARVLGFFVLGLLAAVLLGSLRDICWENLLPGPGRMDGWLLAVLLLPGEGQGGGWLWAFLFCIVTAGVGCSGERALLEMSRSISGFGSVKRLESLAAVGLTLGLYLMAAQLLSQENAGDRAWSVALTAGLFLSGFYLNGWIAAAFAALAWCVLPALCHRKMTI